MEGTEHGQASISNTENDVIIGECPHAGRVGSNEFEIEQLETAESVSYVL